MKKVSGIYRNSFCLWVLACLLHTTAFAQPVSEMRACWVATVANIDWPSKPGLTSDEQKQEFEDMLDNLQKLGMNAVFVQVRPAGDAFYSSKLAPWSRYLNGKQGKAPDPYYDPLEFMIKAAHKRRMEFHAWLNPYRATFDLDTAALAPSHLLRSLDKKDAERWFFKYGKKYYFNPANPSVVAHLTDVVAEILTRYDVDGIHFDDYFYPYKEKDEILNDYAEYTADPKGTTNIEDWRRANVDDLIQSVSKRIRKLKPWVKFGISPFGVWRNADRDPENGSDTRAGLTCYDDLYADVTKWLKNDWIDYVAPQLYWSIGYPPADYAKLVKWWSDHSYGKQLYIGQAAYKFGESKNDPNFNTREEIGRQITLNRSNDKVQGNVFYSAKPLLKNPLGIADSVGLVYNAMPARLPAMEYRSTVAPATPEICRIKGSPSAIRLAWHACNIQSGEEMPTYFAIYRFSGDGVGDPLDPQNIIGYTAFNPEKWIFEDKNVDPGEYYTYVVSSFNRMHVESQFSKPIVVKKTKSKLKRKRKLFGFLFS